MMKDMDTLYASVLVFGIVSALVYQLILRPLFPGPTGQPPPRGAAMGQQQQQHQQQLTSQTSSSPRQRTALKAQACSRVPSHVAPGTRAVNGGNNLLVDGLIAFRYGTAAHQESKRDAAQQATHRKERARVLSRLLQFGTMNTSTSAATSSLGGSTAATSSTSSSGAAAFNSNNGTSSSSSSATASAPPSTPPAKGSTVVLSIPEKDVGCAKLQKIVYLLASYYNLLLLVSVGSEEEEFDRKTQREPLVQKLRGDCKLLSSAILPDHRIVLCSTVAGRVAFCRQLQRIELVLDFDPDIASMLGRFGHRVIVYGGSNSGSNDSAGAGSGATTTSTLGAILEI